MPFFIQKPPVIEARYFNGGQIVAEELARWTDADGFSVANNRLVIVHDDEDGLGLPLEVELGHWLLFDPALECFYTLSDKSFRELFEQVPGE